VEKLFSITGLVFVAAIIGFWFTEADSQTCPGPNMTHEWIECHNAMLHACALVPRGESEACRETAISRYLLKRQVAQRQRPGVSPVSAWQCPLSHPIKGNFTTYNGERCIFHQPGGQFYEKTKPEMCYVSPADAIADGCRQSRR
jgi:hypothetical protein